MSETTATEATAPTQEALDEAAIAALPVVNEIVIGGVYQMKPSVKISQYGGIAPGHTFTVLAIHDVDGGNKEMEIAYFREGKYFQRRPPYVPGIQEFYLISDGTAAKGESSPEPTKAKGAAKKSK